MKFSFLSYFILISAIFLSGLFRIPTKYQLYDSPIDGGFSKLFDWVSTFSYFYIVPVSFLLIFRIYKLVNEESYRKNWVKYAVLSLWLLLLVVVGYLSFFIFVLLFYGFAP